MQKQIQIYAKAYSDSEELGTAQVTEMPKAERIKILSLRVGLFILLAIVAVFIPVLHFILVPGFLVGAIFAGLSALKYTGKVVSGTVKCPHCGNQVELKSGPLSWPLTVICQNCASSLRLLDHSHNEATT